jgi:hypothetical protein
MVSTVKVTNIDTPDNTGNITFDRPIAGDGSGLTSLPAANLTGTVATARLGSGTANSTTFLRGDQTYADPSSSFAGVLVRLSANESIATGVVTVIDWDTAIYETGHDFWDVSSNPSRLTVPSGVTKVKLSASIRWSSNAGSFRQLYIKKNAGNFSGMIAIDNKAPSLFGMNASTATLEVSATDYFEVSVFHQVGSTISVDNTNYGNQVWFAMEVVE